MTPFPSRGRPTAPRLHECANCGLVQTVPALPPLAVAACLRCTTVLRRTHVDPIGVPLALHLSGLVLLAIGTFMTMMAVSRAGIHHQADLLSGPIGLQEHGMGELGLLVLFTTIGAPLMAIGGNIYVLACLLTANPPRHLRIVYGILARLRPWSMIEVYLLGVFVAYTKLGSLVTIAIGPGLYALGALLLVKITAEALSDPSAVWEEIDRRTPPLGTAQPPPPDPRATDAAPTDAAPTGAAPTGAAHWLRHATTACGCETCGLVEPPTPDGRCRRCRARLHPRKPASVQRTWALLIAAAILYIPANAYPALTVIQFGSGAPSTILGGVLELWEAGIWPLALLVFFASVVVPMLKLISLSVLLIGVQRGRTARPSDRTRLYRIVRWIGRWSMIDIFMESILIALVQFGALATIAPGEGAIAFAGVVILTMFAAETFDPRLLWDTADAPAGSSTDRAPMQGHDHPAGYGSAVA